jgi:hypothetical protein
MIYLKLSCLFGSAHGLISFFDLLEDKYLSLISRIFLSEVLIRSTFLRSSYF